MDQSKIISHLNYLKQDYMNLVGDEGAFKLANCYIQLGNYEEAQLQYQRSCSALFGPRSLWKNTSQVNWLADIYILSGNNEFYNNVVHELREYTKDPRRNALVAFYAYGIIELIEPWGWDMAVSIKELLKRPKYKDMYAIGETFQALVDRDLTSFSSSLMSLLKAHDGMVKHGSLRETAEGFICMPGMSLTYFALKRNMIIDIENEYLPMGYLAFLLQKRFR